jgi:BlaI family transcriptional regulator, penicillinase repressor
MSELAKILGPLEARVVGVLWDLGRPAPVREVLERLNDGSGAKLAYTTVMTVMSRLAQKGVLERKAEGRGYVYEAAVRDAAELAVRNVVRDFGDAAVTHFLDEARADPKLMRRLQKLVRKDEE